MDVDLRNIVQAAQFTQAFGLFGGIATAMEVERFEGLPVFGQGRFAVQHHIDRHRQAALDVQFVHIAVRHFVPVFHHHDAVGMPVQFC